MVNLILSTDHINVDELCDLCLSLGAHSVSVAPQNRDETWFQEPGEVRHWTAPRVVCILENETDGKHLLQSLETYYQRPLTHSISTVPEKDWVQATRDQFQPLQVGDVLWVLPPWAPQERYQEPRLIIEPGLAFGTGSHPTTQMILRWLCENSLRDRTVIDWGCGSGILGLAALKLGASKAIGVDIDRQAFQASRDNAQLNAMEFPVYHPEDIPPKTVDIILANILVNPLIELSGRFAKQVTAGGIVLLTGILEPQIDAVISAYRSHFNVTQVDQIDDWVLLAGIRND